MHRAIPVSNKLLSKKWEENNQKIHADKLRQMQSRVNSDRPAQFAHLKYKAKRDQMLEDRFTEIERENRILLEKMSSIMNKKKNQGEGLGLKSLNKTARRERVGKIAMDNQALLKRLQEKKPCYSTHEWKEDRRKKVNILRNIGDFPYKIGRGGSTPASYKKPRKLTPISTGKVFKKGVAIGNKHFVIEIHKEKRNLMIFINDVESPESYSLQLPLNEAKDLMGNTFNYDRLVSMLELDNGEIVLVDPREKVRGLETAPMPRQPKSQRYDTESLMDKKPKTEQNFNKIRNIEEIFGEKKKGKAEPINTAIFELKGKEATGRGVNSYDFSDKAQKDLRGRSEDEYDKEDEFREEQEDEEYEDYEDERNEEENKEGHQEHGKYDDNYEDEEEVIGQDEEEEEEKEEEKEEEEEDDIEQTKVFLNEDNEEKVPKIENIYKEEVNKESEVEESHVSVEKNDDKEGLARDHESEVNEDDIHEESQGDYEEQGLFGDDE